MDLLREMSFLISQPWLALAPSGLFIIAGKAVKSKFVRAVGFMWLIYCLYEFSMKYRILCSGECNIRVDLLLLFPLLILASIAGVVAVVLARLKRSNR